MVNLGAPYLTIQRLLLLNAGQVTREMLNGAIAAMNAHVAQTGAQLEPLVSIFLC